jgi:adenine-specific DNA-methyltransferase
MTEAFDKIRQLVEDFKQQEAFYLSPAYQEIQVRQDFIDKFFPALGWDGTPGSSCLSVDIAVDL